MSLTRRLRIVSLCLALEFGALIGVPIPAEKVRALLEAMHTPTLAHVLREEEDAADEPPASVPPRAVAP